MTFHLKILTVTAFDDDTINYLNISMMIFNTIDGRLGAAPYYRWPRRYRALVLPEAQEGLLPYSRFII